MYVKIKIVRSILFNLEKRSVGNRTDGGGKKKRGGVRQKFKREGNLF
jgi:hypothetical protein